MESTRNQDLNLMSREELLEEVARLDDVIGDLKKEVQKYLSLFHSRKIAVSAETDSMSPRSKVIHKNQKTRDVIESAFLVNEFLCQLEQSQIDDIIQSMYPLDAPAESTIIRQGEHGSQLFVLEEGRVQVSKDNQFIRVMEAPCVFGELAILYHCERTASVKALTPCRVWAIERKIFHSINVNAAKSKHNAIFSVLRRARQFTKFPDKCLHLIADMSTEEEWKYKIELTGNQLVGRIFLVARGNVVAYRASQFGSAPEIQKLQVGDVFGDTSRIRDMIQALHGASISPSTPQTASPRRHGCLRPNERFLVDSVDGCHLYTMLVDQICRQLEHTALIEDAALPQKSADDLSQIELCDLKTISTIGVGGFGRVNLVKHVDTDKVYALKILNKAHIKEMNQQEHVLNERNILMACRNDFIIRLYRSFRDSERLYMLTEYCPGGEVWTMLRSWGRFDEQTSRFYCAAALEAFDYLHRHFIVYRDLKPENMLLDKNGIPKLADFGFAKCLKTESGRTFTFCGTAEYVAPEVILNKGQSIAVDLWALGIFMYELISGSPPFASTDPMYTYNSILKGVQSLAWPKYFSDNAKSLICKFCRKEPAQRLGYGRIEDARRDPWFQNFDFVAFRNHSMRPPIKPKVLHAADTQNFDRYPSFDNFASGVDESGWDLDF